MRSAYLIGCLLCASSVFAQAPIAVTSPDGKPVVVTFIPPAVPGVCTPASGSAFEIGQTLVTCVGSSSFSVTVEGAALVQAKNLTYLGAFRLPNDPGFDYPGQGLAVSSRGLFVTGNRNKSGGPQIAEVSNPTPVNTAVLTDLPRATLLQALTEPTEGKNAQASVPGTPTFIGDSLVVGDRVCLTLFAYYDANSKQPKAIVCRPTDLSDRGHVTGPMAVASTPAVIGVANVNRLVNGYLADIPKVHQSALGGAVAIGGTPANISGGASNGDDLFATDLTALTDPHPVTPGLYFPQTNPEAYWNAQSDIWNGTVGATTSCEVPDQFGSVLCIHRIGLGPYCYGNSTTDQSLDGTVNTSGIRWCYDPASSPNTKGGHAYPYVIRVNAYRIADLGAVRAGTLKPWDVRPYAGWNLDVPFLDAGASLYGVAYDHTTHRVYLTAGKDGNRSLVQVYQVTP